jgi:predicted amidohydrolase YtcJ
MRSEGKRIDLALINGKILSLDRKGSIFSALAVRGNRIAALGTDKEIHPWLDRTTKIIDLKGRFLVPGFIDSHNHPEVYGARFSQISCNDPAVKSIEDLKKLIRSEAEKRPQGEWIQAFGYNEKALSEKRHPNRWDLDEAAPHHPMYLGRVCLHVGVVNSAALNLAGIGEKTPDIPGGVIEKKGGKLTGVLKGTAHRLLRPFLPRVGIEQYIHIYQEAFQRYLQFGITSIHAAGVGMKSPEELKSLVKMDRENLLPLRVYMMVAHKTFPDHLEGIGTSLKETGLMTGFGNSWLRIGPIKILVDGGGSSQTAATRQPYSNNPSHFGLTLYSQEDLRDVVSGYHRAGFQLAIHAVGDKGIEMVLHAIREALEKYPKPDHRHRIEHCALMDEKMLEEIRALGIIPVSQPSFLYSLGENYLDNFGPQRMEYGFPLHSFQRRGILVAGSSDCPVTDFNPLLGIYSAVCRRTAGGKVLNKGERVGVMEALKMYTYNGAYASFEEKDKGSIEVGRLADIAVLSEDLLEVNPEEIKDVKVSMTIVDGKILYDRDGHLAAASEKIN